MQVQVAVILAAMILGWSKLSVAAETTVKEGDTVTIEYTVKDESGKIVDSNVGEKPLTVHLNGKEIIPGLEKRMVGMKEGESRKIVVPAKEAYGEHRDDLVMEIPLERLPEGVKVGDTLQIRAASGQVFPCKVVEIDEKEKIAKIDVNHPLAGQDLTFEVKVLEVSS